MAKINLLDKSIFELIAAGEVIERPASVIKELAENAIDAGAKHITIEIKNGGSSFMRVTDDGCGIAHDEIPTAFLRHATSKVKTADDLNSIMTLGFRGEALASVAAVSRVELLTKEPSEQYGSSFRISGGEILEHERAGCPDGTTIIIRDLFYNVPARQKFLKKDVSEGNQVQGLVDKLALSNPDICFRFIRDNKAVRTTGGDGDYYSAIYAVFGKQFASSLIPVDYSSGSVAVTGYISSPLFTRANRSMQYFFVNGRSVRSPICMAALEEGYRNSIMTGKFPACVLSISVPPDTCDVNVSPSKTEVRFSEEKLIFDAVNFGVRNAILNADNRREVRLEKKDQPQKQSEPIKTENIFMSHIEKALEQVQPKSAEEYKNEIIKNLDDERIYKIREPVYLHSPLQPLQTVKQTTPFVQQRIEEAPTPEPPSFRYLSQASFEKKEEAVPETVISAEPEKPKMRVIGELFESYIICQCGEEMILIDKHAAHERIRFEKKKKELITSSQLLAESEFVELNPEQYSALSENTELLSDAGIEIILHNGNKGEITAAPSALTGGENTISPSELVIKAADLLCSGNCSLIDELYDELLHSRACKSAIKAHDVNNIEELRVIAEEVWSNDNIRFCPHGRPVMAKLTKYEIEKYFSRIV